MSKSPFLSRIGLIENLRNHLLAGKSAAMVGGPMIGKSILAQNLADQIRAREATPILVPLKKVVSPGALWSLLMEMILYQGIGPGRKNPYRKNPETLPELMTQLHHIYEKVPLEMAARPLVFLLDDAETLLPFSDDLIPQIINLAFESVSPSIQSICWIGGAAWEEWMTEHAAELKSPIRLYPLSVIPIREAKKIIKEQLGSEHPSEEAERIWTETGGHPYLLEKAFNPKEKDVIDTLSDRLLQPLRPSERAVLNRLDRSGNWTRLDELIMEDGQHPPKALLDRLCMLGLIIRTLMDGVAAVRMTSPLLMKAE